MADFTLTIPDAELDRVTAALCTAAGLDDTVDNAKAAVIGYIEATVVTVETSQAQLAALAALPDPTAPIGIA